MRVLVYVEGPSDRAALEALLAPLIRTGQERGVGVRFLAAGDKGALLRDVARHAADHLSEHPNDWVFALPDLYPMAPYDGTENAHRSHSELQRLLQGRFTNRASRVGVPDAALEHFAVYCLKHDLEVLLLAAPDALRGRLNTTDALRGRWHHPVEDQNGDHPPKRIVEALFASYRGKPAYIDTVDAPWILRRANLDSVMSACPQQFAPFVTRLRELVT